MLIARKRLGVAAAVAALGLVAGAALWARHGGDARPAAGAGAKTGSGSGNAERLPRIDVHMHVGPTSIERLLALMDRWGIDGIVNLSGMYPGPPNNMLETQLEAARRTG